MVDVLAAAVEGKVSAIITGGTGSGKTTLLNAMSQYIPSRERLITIEDAAELQLQQPHVGRLETRPANIEGKGEVRQRDLVRNALRMRPDRIIVGECRGEEAFDMLQAMNTGHEGSMTTIHAELPARRAQAARADGGHGRPSDDAFGHPQPDRLRIDPRCSSSAALPDGSRRVTSVSEITGMEGEVIQMHEIFRYVKEFTDAAGKMHGSFKATGIRPQFLADLKAYGIEIPLSSHFDPAQSL